MVSLLITGGAGFIGTNFVYYWRKKNPDHKIIVLDLLTYAGRFVNIQPLVLEGKVEFFKGDICDESLVADLFRRFDFKYVVHFAAESHVDRSIVSPNDFVRTNILGTLSLLNAARSARSKTSTLSKFHHVSTDEVYGSLELNAPPFTELHPYAPRSPYAASKAASDHLVRSYGHTYGLPISLSNCSNNYGAYQNPEKLVPLMLTNMLEGRRLPVYGDGRNIRDWLHVEDHCRALGSIIERGSVGETYNIGGNSEVANIDLVSLLCGIVDERFKNDMALCARFPDSPAARGGSVRELVDFVTDRPGHDRRYAINASKILSDLDFRPSVKMIEGLLKTVDWYIANEPWWRETKEMERLSKAT